ncbi:MAG: hypothetical protein KIT83_05475 [Bryobacterales bacterium]|nr:hypothetical protein [Bryobacterales bacterium]
MSVFFPQLRPGSALQYPLRKAVSYRTVVHPGDAVTNLRSADDGDRRVEWSLHLRGLNDAELASVQSLYRAMRGSHGEFVFLDPGGNLLARSEDLLAPVWSKSVGLSVAAAETAPSAAEAAFALQSQAGQSAELWQSLALPTNYHWLLSVYARAAVPAPLTLVLRSVHGEQQHPVTLTQAWRRYWFGGLWWPAGEGIDVGLRLPGNTAAEASALQLETQTSPAAYKRTTTANGAFTQARFLDDELHVTTLAPNCHQMNLRIGAPLAG